ncbi:uncharacterized protein C17orf67 homolog isoform X2 [Myotis lucifugus]|uniref:uncharacterized protein C17orf67 homolog isoform X2 n=1 Tax=Myotis lucifugus TaxID=59463 RepID=UPI000CCC2E55|nr:uncharacterized protein C17orf67 homolog isoform X2 [Myotis lucifugus]
MRLILQQAERGTGRMKKLFVFALLLTFLTFSGASPILTEKEAKQLLRSRRQDRPSKPGFPDEPMRVSSGLLLQTYCCCVQPSTQLLI